jgi:hypothetical protein
MPRLSATALRQEVQLGKSPSAAAGSRRLRLKIVAKPTPHRDWLVGTIGLPIASEVVGV